jgi:pyrophosphatase PpaX
VGDFGRDRVQEPRYRDGMPGGRPRWPCVVFDLDGTLVDTIDLIVDSYQYAFETVLGSLEDEARIRAWIGQPLIRAFREASPQDAERLYETYLEWNQANTERLIRRYAGIDRLLRDLSEAGVVVAAATSKRRASAEMAADLTGLSSHLDVLVTMEDTILHKPDPEPLLLAVNRLGATPDQAVYVGDAIVDVQAARNAGMAAVAVTWGAGVREALEAMAPDVVAETVDDLREALLPTRGTNSGSR